MMDIKIIWTTIKQVLAREDVGVATSGTNDFNDYRDREWAAQGRQDLTDKAREAFINEGYDINFGARPLKRLVGRTLEVDLSRLLIEGQIKEHDIVIVNYVNDKYIIKKKI